MGEIGWKVSAHEPRHEECPSCWWWKRVGHGGHCTCGERHEERGKCRSFVDADVTWEKLFGALEQLE